MNISQAWGWHTIIDSSGCNLNISNPNVIQNFIDDLINAIDMIKIGNTHIIWCDTHDPLKCGYSVYQLLQDSNISIHFCPDNNNLAFCDIFSCKEYQADDVIDVFKKYFSPKLLKYDIISREILL